MGVITKTTPTSACLLTSPPAGTQSAGHVYPHVNGSAAASDELSQIRKPADRTTEWSPDYAAKVAAKAPAAHNVEFFSKPGERSIRAEFRDVPDGAYCVRKHSRAGLVYGQCCCDG